nr:hypothetical protein [Tanacetum cinerariifolium]
MTHPTIIPYSPQLVRTLVTSLGSSNTLLPYDPRIIKKSKKRSLEDLKLQEQDTRRTSGNTTRIDPFPPSLIL